MVCLEGCVILLNFECVLVNLYRFCDMEERSRVWYDVWDFISTVEKLYFIIGDFNKVVRFKDRLSGFVEEKRVRDFKIFIFNTFLMEVFSADNRFIWYRGSSSSKLDKFFVNSEWFDYFLFKVTLLERSVSDYYFFFTMEELNWGFKLFCFFYWWFLYKGCLEII